MFKRNKLQPRVVTMVLISAIFLVIHYYFHFVHLENFELIRIVANTINATFCLLGMLFLTLNSTGIRSQKVFAFEMGMVGIAALIVMIIGVVCYGNPPTSQLLSPTIMIYGNTYAFICMLYPIELFSRKKPSIYHYILIFLPALAIGVLYYVIIYMFNLPIIEINSWHDLISNIEQFNVWFRFTIFIYPIFWFVRTLRMKSKYKQWCQENYSEMKYIDFSWINYYFLGYFIILCSYMIVVLENNLQSYIAHNIVFIIFFAFGLHNVLKQAIPPTTSPTNKLLDAADALVVDNESSVTDDLTDNNADKYRFVDKMPEYKVALENWMKTDKPHLNKDFRLLDVMNVLPLNRSYLSRMFNEAYSETFFSFVMRYRIDESLNLLKNRPDLTISRIAQMCGFSSPSVFGRAFLKSEGITPNQYRSQHGIK